MYKIKIYYIMKKIEPMHVFKKNQMQEVGAPSLKVVHKTVVVCT